MRSIARFLAATLLVSSGSATILFAQMDFNTRRDVGAGPLLRGIAVGDLNNDGKKDIVAASATGGYVSILLNAGSGIFRAPTQKATGLYPIGVVLGNFNADSNLDLAVACFLSDQVQIFLGNGAGGFGNPTSITLPLGSNPQALAIVDWNVDGKKDLLVVNHGTSEVRLYNGNGLGGFTLAGTYPVFMNPLAITTGDWDGDTRVDLAVVSEGDTTLDPIPNGVLTVMYGCPTGFCFPATASVPPLPTSVTAGLLNNDTFPDLLVGTNDPLASNLQIFYYDEALGYTTSVALATGTAPESSVVADVNGDGKNDLFLGTTSSQIKVFTGDGFGTFTLGGSFSIGSSAEAFAVQDIGGSTALDIATVNNAAGSISILMGNGTAGGFTSPSGYAFAAVTDLSALASGKLNSDNFTDLAVAQTDIGQLNVLFGSGTGTFSAGPVLTLPGNNTSTFALPSSVGAGNFTSDTNTDLVTLNNGLDNISVFTGNGAGVFTGPANVATGCTISGDNCDSSQLALGPLNDTDTTHPDLVVANPFGDSSFPNGSISVFLQNATGFANPTRYTGGSGPICDGGFTVGAVCSTNADCSGRCETATGDPGAVCTSDSQCPNPFLCANPAPGACRIGPIGMAVGKVVSSDPNYDLVVAESVTDVASYLPGNGTGAFSSISSSAATGTAPRYPILKDLDGDGDLDLIMINRDSENASLFLGDNAGGFTQLGGGASPVLIGPSPWRGALADFNLDGFDDLAVNDIGGGCVSILLGDGTGKFGMPVRFGTGVQPQDLVVADFNGDGKPDLAVSCLGTATVSVLLNQSQNPLLTINQIVAGTQVLWTPMWEATRYDVIRGNRANVTQTATQINLGAVTCIENDSVDASTAGNEDNSVPPAGQVYFYLFRTQDGQISGSYGRSDAGKLRVPASGDCL